MDLLSKAIQSTKQEREDLKSRLRDGDGRQQRQWVRRGDLDSARRKRYLEQQQEEEQKRRKSDGGGNGPLRKRRRRRRSSGGGTDSGNDDYGSSSDGDGYDDDYYDDDDDDDGALSPAASGRDDEEEEDVRTMMQTLGRDDVFRLLRRLGQPVTFFGETDVMRVRRLRRVQLQVGEHAKGQRNVDWVKEQNEMLLLEEQRIRERQEQHQHQHQQQKGAGTEAGGGGGDGGGDDDAAAAGRSAAAAASSSEGEREKEEQHQQEQPDAASRHHRHHHHHQDVTGGTRDSDNNSSGSGSGSGRSSSGSGGHRRSLPLQPDGMSDEDYVRRLLRRLLSEWEQTLEARPISVKKTAQGRADYAMWRQTKEYIRPLFKQLKKGTLDADVLLMLRDIVHQMARRDYTAANDMYLRLAIGNAPWPMGVTMVGIHERSARQKISGGAVAHILNDEKSRKYIQCVKRLISFCEKTYPDDDDGTDAGNIGADHT